MVAGGRWVRVFLGTSCMVRLFLSVQFRDESGVEYCCAEQYMMAGKARTMRDDATLAQILACRCVLYV